MTDNNHDTDDQVPELEPCAWAEMVVDSTLECAVPITRANVYRIQGRPLVGIIELRDSAERLFVPSSPQSLSPPGTPISE